MAYHHYHRTGQEKIGEDEKGGLKRKGLEKPKKK
jgi:hypothetical protein